MDESMSMRDFNGMSDREFIIKHYGAVLQSDGSYLDCDGHISWFNDDGDAHREDGPSYILPNGDVEWSFNDINYGFEEWLKVIPISDEEKMLLRLQYG
jgi:hypothetical protein